jgi:hypothetical protein
MAFKGTSSKSSSGASMSQYDVEVEARLKKLEAKAHEKCDSGDDANQVQELKKAIFENGISPERFEAVERKVNLLVDAVQRELRVEIE